MIALIVIGLGWYLLGPSGEPLWGVPIALLGIVALVLLFRRPENLPTPHGDGRNPGDQHLRDPVPGGPPSRASVRSS